MGECREQTVWVVGKASGLVLRLGENTKEAHAAGAKEEARVTDDI